MAGLLCGYRPGVSTLRRLDLPAGVAAGVLRTRRGSFGVLRTGPSGADAPVVLLVPGWTGSRHDFATLLPVLAGHGLQAVAIDQRGQQGTPGSSDAAWYAMDALAADVLAVGEALHDGPVHVVGHSFGGLVGARAAVDAPASVAGLTLLCSGPGALPADRHAEFVEVVATLDAEGLEGVWSLLLRRERESGATPSPPEVEAWLRARFVAQSLTAFRAQTLHLIDSPDLTPALARRPVPVQVVTGEDDDVWPLPLQRQMAVQLQAPYRQLVGCAHSPAVDDPEATGAVIVEHVRTHAGPAVLIDRTLTPVGPAAVPAARHAARAALTAQADVPASVVDDVELVVSELVTNALLHARPPVRLVLLRRGGLVEVQVHDGGDGCEQQLDGRPHHGRGRQIVAALAGRHGAWADATGCCAWAQVSVRHSDTSAEPSTGSSAAHGSAAGAAAAAPSGHIAR